jgi:hypothetical protein
MATKQSEYIRSWRQKPENREKYNAYQREWNSRPGNAEKNRARCESYRKTHLKERREYLFALRKNNPVKFLVYEAKRRAKINGVEFSITVDDVYLPEFCPVLGIRLVFGTSKIRDTSPTIDRVDNSKGYIPGNVKIISWRANTLKNCGSAEEHEAIAAYIRREKSENVRDNMRFPTRSEAET